MKEFIDKLIERLEELRKMNVDMIGGYCQSTISKSIDIVNELAEEYIKTSTISKMETVDWIPCERELPKYTDEYNVTVDVASEFGCYRTVKTLRFERIEGKEPKWVIPQDEVYRVIAWCELPAPYTEGE